MGKGVVDGGASGHVMVSLLANQLMADGLIFIEQPTTAVNIVWGGGKEAAVVGIAFSDGVLQNVYIVDVMSTPLLISEYRLCELGILFVKNQQYCIGFQQGLMVLYAEAAPLSPGDDSLWLCDLESLFSKR